MIPRNPSLTAVAARLTAAGSVYADDEAALLLEAADDSRALRALVAERVAGVPLEHILGWAEFDGRRVAVTPGVFVPRQRTLLLARAAIAALPAGGSPIAVELCCGSGAVAAALANARPGLTVHAADIDPVAIACATTNLAGRGDVHPGDLFEPLPFTLRGRISVLVANAPYVPTAEIDQLPSEARDHEPRHALDGGTDGLDVQRRLIAAAPDWLAPQGVLLIETSRHQAERTEALCSAAGLRTDTLTDDTLDATVVRAAR